MLRDGRTANCESPRNLTCCALLVPNQRQDLTPGSIRESSECFVHAGRSVSTCLQRVKSKNCNFRHSAQPRWTHRGLDTSKKPY
jgi:hypothetical protein